MDECAAQDRRVRGVMDMRSTLKMVLVFALVSTLSVAGDGGVKPASPQRQIVVENYYYAKAGNADEVYQWRLHASDVRARLGFARGRVLRRILSYDQTGQSKELPDVVWQCEYPSIEARQREADAISTKPEFEEVQKHMSTLLRRFERVSYRVSS